MKKYLLVAFVSWLLHHFGDFYGVVTDPRLSPHSNESFSPALHYRLWHSWSLLRSQFFHLVRRDARYVTQSLFSLCTPSSTRRQSCPLNVLPHTDNFLRTKIMGQDRALFTVASVLDGWDRNSMKPVALLFTGPTGVGKRLTAYAISEWVFSHCVNDDSTRRGVLTMHGEDFAISTQDNNMDRLAVVEYQRHRLTKQIVSHVRSQEGDGAIVIVTGLDVMDVSVLDVFTELLGGDAVLSYTDTVTDKWGRAEGEVTVEVTCRDVIFILLSGVGSDLVTDIALHYGREEIPKMVLEAQLREEMVRHWGGNFKLGTLVNAVVPFMPLTNLQLKEIITRRIQAVSNQYALQYWKRLDVTTAAKRQLAGQNFIEYEFFEHSNGNSMWISKYGAHILIGGGPMHILISKVRRHFTPHRPHEIALFDYEEERREAVLSWCIDQDKVFDKNIKCEEVWRGLLDYV